MILYLLLAPRFLESASAQNLVGPWQKSGLAEERFVINGTGDRHNPLRRKVSLTDYSDEVYVRFKFRYEASTIDEPTMGNGEFFVMWFDSLEGSDSSPHANNIPNLGVHTDGNTNRFMVRFRSSQQVFAEPLVGGRDYLLVGCLAKSDPRSSKSYDQLELWIDPAAEQRNAPNAQTTIENSINKVNWVGFSTGMKTELEDEIVISDFRIGRTWAEIMDLPYDESQSKGPTLEHKKTVAFGHDVLPILREHCFDCHQGQNSETDLRLDQFDQVLHQVTPFQAEESELYRLIRESEMPPGTTGLSHKEMDVIRAWIDEGIEWDADLLPHIAPKTDHWAFQPIEKPGVPSVSDQSELRNPIDAFLSIAQQRAGVIRNPPASQDQLSRRMHLDMLGLPVIGNENEESNTIQDFLYNPAYGERWARHWLDVVRWGESNGYQHNRDRKYAWHYRDWVVQALSQGMSFRDFITMQIAGDELKEAGEDGLIATGFLAAGRYSGNELDKNIQRNDILNDITSNFGSVFLGLTIQCAQCHDHKFDPITIRDYYQLQGFFSQGQPQNLLLESNPSISEIARQRQSLFDSVKQRVIRLRRKQKYPEPINVTPSAVISRMQAGEKELYKSLQSQLELADQTWGFFAPATAARELTVMPHEMRWPLDSRPEVVSSIQPRILIRGDINTPGPAVNSDWPIVFRSGEPQSQVSKSRIELAEWLSSSDNPLTARVWVNRIWQWHFGQGLVETSNDFGVQGNKPSHPELLDYLAWELIQSDWDTNRIHQLILDSATYRVSSDLDADNQEMDPANLTYWRWKPRRLEAEVIRDSMLLLAGKLINVVGGPSVGNEVNRRSLYLKQKRGEFPYQQNLFDGPNGLESCARREVSTNALQPLWLLNSEFVHEMAESFANRAKTIHRVFRLALNRAPAADELKLLEAVEREHGLASVCLVIFNSSEFLYLP